MSVAVDPRAAWVARHALNHFFVSSRKVDDRLPNLSVATEVAAFLDDLNRRILDVQLSLQLGSSESGAAVVVFVKTRLVPITDENLTEVVAVSAIGSAPPAVSFSGFLSSLYAPLVLRNAQALPAGLKSALADLQSGLMRTASQHAAQAASAQKYDDRDLSSARTLKDEFQYWYDVSQQCTVFEIAERARLISDIYKPISAVFTATQGREISEIIETLDKAQDSLDAIWKLKRQTLYPEERMVHVLGLFGQEIIRFLQSSLGAMDIWRDPFSTVREQIRRSLHLIEKWISVTDVLTTQLWPGYQPHKWVGRKFVDESIAAFKERLEEVSSLRTVHEQTASIFGEQQLLSGSIDVLASASALDSGPYSRQRWREAVQEYGRAIAGAEARVAAVLRRQFSTLSNQPYQLLKEFQRYKDLVARPAIARELAQERETLLSQLISYVSGIRDEFSGFSASDAGSSAGGERRGAVGGRNTPEVVASIVWVRQQITKVEGTLSTSEALLKELPAHAKLVAIASQMLQDLKVFQREQLASWSKDIEELLDDPDSPLALEAGKRLIEFDDRGKLQVNFHERLVQLIREVRQLTALGFKVPAAARSAADAAVKFHRHGVVLKQVANFYNRFSSEMINSQKSMLLELAVAFSEVVKSSAGGRSGEVTWGNSSDIELYIDRVQHSAEKLATENWKLRKCHTVVAEKVAQLAGTDLLKHEAAWREILKDIRGIFSSLQEQGYKPERMKPWMIHWDHQLYKVLEMQYRRGLNGLSDSVSDIPCDLCLKQGVLQFRPPFEILRTQYYSIIQKFIKFPLQFKGVGSADIFRHMADRNAKSFVNVYRYAEDLFSRLEKEKDQFVEWAMVSNVDADQFCEQQLHEADDWEYNFRMVKLKGRQAEKLPMSRRIGCIVVSFSPIRATIDDVLQRLSDALVNSLVKSIDKDAAQVLEFVNESLGKLAKKLTCASEVAEASAEYKSICERKSAALTTLTKCAEKNRLLNSVVGQTRDIDEVLDKWEQMDSALLTHDQQIQRQIEELKGDIERRILEFSSDLTKYASRWTETRPKQSSMLDKDSASAALITMKTLVSEFEELRAKCNQLVAECQQFDLEKPTFPLLETVSDDIAKSQAIWALYSEFTAGKDKISGEPWMTFRTHSYIFEDFIADWEAKTKAAKEGGQEAVYAFVRNDLERYKEAIPLLKFLRGDAFMADHWRSLFALLGLPKTTDPQSLTFGTLIGCVEQILANSAAIKDLHLRANGEVTIRDAMQELKAWGLEAKFALTEHDEGGRVTPLIKDWKELITAIGDNQALLNSLKDSPYFGPFSDEAREWEVKLGNLDKYVRSLNIIQRKWLYLEPIFARGALPQEQPRFKAVDSKYVEIMKEIQHDPRVVNIASAPALGDTLNTLQEQLDRCQTALSQYLEEKRARFPRFYFLGDDDLLEILGQSRNPAVIQTHLKKLFQGINRVDFSSDGRTISAMRSIAGEAVPLARPVAVSEYVEVWLNGLAEEMKSTLRGLLLKCMQVFDVRAFPSQILNLAENVHFTSKCEASIESPAREGALVALEKETRESLERFALLDAGEDKVVALKVKSLLYDIIHNLDVVLQLKAAKVTSLSDWVWQKQLRYYVNDKNLCVIRMGEATCDYTYEYQGNAPKLVYTPLTDKCYLTLTQGMIKGYGGNPYGPAGTGKTESVKALGQVMGRQVLVFNCDEGIDFKSMGRMFTGLIKCGAWGCFDEFNRLDEEVLSAVSQQIQVIQGALKNKAPTVTLLEKTIEVDQAAGIFVTLNPAGKNYGGRSKLPDNLKQLFRPVAMSIPDLDLIAEVMLYSEGFTYAKDVGEKLVAVFKLARQLLSPQQHYDWGLRALKSILGAGGLLVQDAKKKAKQAIGPAVDKSREAEIVVQALRVNTLSKLIHSDCERFSALIKDLFPTTECNDVADDDLAAAVKVVLDKAKMSVLDSQMKKIMQLNENLKQRMGVVVVGPSGCGKSTLWRTLRAALLELKVQLNQYTMNPKAIARQQLLGHMDPDTREWTDGILTAACRQVAKEPPDVRSWVVCDGDVDPEWIESLNSVLDDNRLLTLPNGERIQFGPGVNFLFESDNLKFASPATVSRMGMIFMDEADISKPAILESWLQHQPQENQQMLRDNLKGYFDRALMMAANEQMAVPTTLVGTIKNGLSHLGGVKHRNQFMLALIRGFGGNFATIERRHAFAREVFAWFGETPPDRRRPLDCFVDEASGALLALRPQHLDIAVTDLALEPMIPTVECMANVELVVPCLRSYEPLVLVGPEGCGKNMLLRHCFAQLKSTSVATLHCSSQTTATHVIQKLNQACSVQSSTIGRVYRPKDTERLILYLKDINLPKPDKYETMQLISFLQQLLTYGGFYGGDGEWLTLERIQIVASMTPSSTIGRHALSGRFTSIVRVFTMAYPEKEQLQDVYTTYLSTVVTAAVKTAQWKQQKNIERLAKTMVDVYEAVKAKFSVDEYPHYIFTPRDLTRWVLGLLQYDHDSADLLEIWTYEAHRIFRDKIVGEAGLRKFDQILDSALKQWDVPDPAALTKDSLFVTLGSQSKRGAHQLSKIGSKDLTSQVKRGILFYEREVKELHLVLFRQLFDSVARIDRVLSKPGGALLLVGKSGVGRNSAVQLVSYMHGRMKLFTPNMSRDYSVKNFAADLKGVLQAAGIAGEQVVLLVEDHQLVEPAIIEYLNSLLSAGEVPGLFAPEELDGLLMPLKETATAEGFFGSTFDYFVNRVRANVHVVLIMDPDNREFQQRCQSNPALYTRCTMQWVDQWYPDSLSSLAMLSLKYAFPENPKKLASVVDMLVRLYHDSAKRSATPRSFVRLLDTYKAIYESKYNECNKRKTSLGGGLKKLGEAAQTVDKLSGDASVKAEELEKANAEANKTMQEIEKNLGNAAKQKTEMKKLSEALSAEEQKLLVQKEKIEEQLSKIQPLIDSARAAVGNIDKKNVDEIRNLRNPGETIRNIMEAVVRLMGQTDVSWNNIKTFLGQSGVVSSIMRFDPGSVRPDTRLQVEDLMTSKASSFEPENAKHASLAALPLATWATAVVEYSKVKQSVAPLEERLAAATSKLSSSRNKITELEKNVKKIDDEVTRLKKQFQGMTAEAMKLETALGVVQETLSKAQSLLSKLSGERDRWQAQLKDIEAQIEALPMSALLAAGFVTYLAGCPEDMRAEIVASWVAMVGLKEWNFVKFLGSETEMLTFKGEGLPADSLSMENALVVKWTTGVPFLVDPSSQASTWLVNHLQGITLPKPAADAAPEGQAGKTEAPSGEAAGAQQEQPKKTADEQELEMFIGDLFESEAAGEAVGKAAKQTVEVTTQEDPKFVNKLELAVRFGKILVVKEVDRINPILYPIIRRDLVRQGAAFAVQIGDKPMTWNEEFRIFLVTRDPNPDLPPDARALLTEANFTVTRSGLEGQLLMLAIQHEKPELEKTKMMHLLQEEENKVQMERLEEQLLEQLAKSEGNILQNKELIASLEETKEKAVAISASLEASQKAQEELDVQRNVYKPIAKSGSSLFFVMQDLGKVNHMYRFSLGSFLPLFDRAMSDATVVSAMDVNKRIDSIVQCLKTNVLSYVSRSLFKADRLMFGMHLAHVMTPALFQPKEWELFTGQLVSGIADVKPDKIPQWVPKDRYTAYAELELELPRLVSNIFINQPEVWGPWVTHPEPETEWPQKVKPRTSPFQRALLVKVFRPDRLESAMALFCSEALGVTTLSPPALNLSRFYTEETTSRDPVLLIVTPGADPSQELEELADKVVGSGKFFQVAMGQGQQEVALQAIRSAAPGGGWVILKNLHLAISWMPTLEKELNMMHPHEGFRLWLTAESHPRFSTILLQSSTKITYEAPPGIKKNLERTYEGWGADFVGRGTPLRAQSLFVLAWFHAVIQERRKYIPQSWTKFYEFNEADLRAATDVLERTLNKPGAIDWTTVHGLLENAVYGGRVDNVFDGNILRTYLRQYFSADLLSPSGPRHPLAPKVDLPSSANRADYAAAIARLPESEPPAYFGLPANIDRSLQRTNSARVIAQLKIIALPAETSGRFDRKAWEEQLTPLIQTWQRLTEGSGSALQAIAEPDDPSRSPVDGFALMETINSRAAVAHVGGAMQSLAKIIAGKALLTPDMQTTGSFLLRGQVPRAWEALWEGPETPVAWLKALVQKTVALDRWLKRVREGTLLKNPVNLNDLFRPATFLDALRQQSARAEKMTVDELKLVTVWSSTVRVSAKIPVVLEGLLIQGCAFESGKIVEASAGGAELLAVPKCLVAWIPKAAPNPYAEGTTCEVPVYQNLLREKIVCVLTVPCTPPADKWALAGVAFFLSEE
eukprot:m51a1_g4355 putative cytoplasmic dynein 2 heavy chain 1 (4311) ;mRNA; f:228679-242475